MKNRAPQTEILRPVHRTISRDQTGKDDELTAQMLRIAIGRERRAPERKVAGGVRQRHKERDGWRMISRGDAEEVVDADNDKDAVEHPDVDQSESLTEESTGEEWAPFLHERWSKLEFNRFRDASAAFGRKSYEKIAYYIGSKSIEEVKKFANRFRQLEELRGNNAMVRRRFALEMARNCIASQINVYGDVDTKEWDECARFIMDESGIEDVSLVWEVLRDHDGYVLETLTTLDCVSHMRSILY